ncbi:UNVERIFIED_CONTAM: hypothetical protein HDU68_012218 [Siphonaria sp. JEL0065]|nr:hypothetical protein HDU68_012218 [Siphonaria sp. JEL0065]
MSRTKSIQSNLPKHKHCPGPEPFVQAPHRQCPHEDITAAARSHTLLSAALYSLVNSNKLTTKHFPPELSDAIVDRCAVFCARCNRFHLGSCAAKSCNNLVRVDDGDDQLIPQDLSLVPTNEVDRCTSDSCRRISDATAVHSVSAFASAPKMVKCDIKAFECKTCAMKTCRYSECSAFMNQCDGCWAYFCDDCVSAHLDVCSGQGDGNMNADGFMEPLADENVNLGGGNLNGGIDIDVNLLAVDEGLGGNDVNMDVDLLDLVDLEGDGIHEEEFEEGGDVANVMDIEMMDADF